MERFLSGVERSASELMLPEAWVHLKGSTSPPKKPTRKAGPLSASGAACYNLLQRVLTIKPINRFI